MISNRLCIASCLTLFTELAIIRWLSTEVRIFAYAKNLALLLCFLGFGVGCALAGKRVQWRTGIQAILGLILLVRNPWAAPMFEGLSRTLGAGQDVHIWVTTSVRNGPNFLLATVIVGIVFFFLTSIFIPLGQVVSREIDAAKGRLSAYSWNLGASLLGIVLFFVMSWTTMPPVIWFGAILLGLAVLQDDRRWRAVVALMIVPSAFLLYKKSTPDHFDIWTPYQQIGVQKFYFGNGEWKSTNIDVNHTFYQHIVDLSPAFLSAHPELLRQPVEESPYNLPFRFAVANPKVLIVGAGTGNDVAAAVRSHSRAIDAVEIDPVILKLGLTHPEKPYQSPLVITHVADARAFMKQTRQRYDLILFGLLDSHTEGSEYTNIRIDNYVYTEESIREARNLLSPDGVLFLKFEAGGSGRAWIGQRLYDLLSHAFEKPPTVFRAPSSYGEPATCFAISRSKQVEGAVARDPALTAFVARHAQDFPSEASSLTSDDWPYLYQQKRGIPALFLSLSLLVLLIGIYSSRTISAERSLGGSALFFFAMGAGFLLLETQTVSRLALFFGTTWQVNGIAIASILVALMIANLVVEKHSLLLNQWWVLAALLVSLLGIYFLPFDRIPGSVHLVGSIAAFLFAVPVFFAGLLFAGEFRSSTLAPSTALAANMLGAVLGGLMENLSLVIGLKALLLITFAFYLTAGLGLLQKSTTKRLALSPSSASEARAVPDSGGF